MLSAAEHLLQELGVTKPQEIDLEAIAYHCGVQVRYKSMQGCEAQIIGTHDKAVALINENSIPQRRRFSVAHELGHWHFHRGKILNCRTLGDQQGERGANGPERAADRYAADLLLPKFIFEPMAMDAKRASFETVDKLREEFNTSRMATSIRLVEFSPEPAMLICHGPNGRKWFTRPSHIPDHWFPSDELDPDGYAMDVLHGQEERSQRRLMPADAWFDRLSAKKYELFEQSIKISNKEILTLLVFKDDEMLEEES